MCVFCDHALDFEHFIVDAGARSINALIDKWRLCFGHKRLLEAERTKRPPEPEPEGEPLDTVGETLRARP